MINDDKFSIRKIGADVIAYSENGDILPIVITEYDTKYVTPSLFKEPVISTRATFGTNYGPFYKTNKVLVEVLGGLSAITGVASLKINHPVLNLVSVVSGVGNYAYATLYIKYYQAYVTNDPIYVKETDYYYTSLVKARTWYFYSSRPS